MKRKMFQKDLAAALNISASMVTRLKQHGMPIHSIAAARRWRELYLDPALVKESRGPFSEALKINKLEGSGDSLALDLVDGMTVLATEDFDRWQAKLREALRLVPMRSREKVVMPTATWDLLTATVRADIKAFQKANGPPATDLPDFTDFTDDDETFVSNFWYDVAASGAIPATDEGKNDGVIET